MTLISAFQISGCPLLIGDLLISGPSNNPDRFNFPTKSGLNKPYKTGRNIDPVGLCQKANLLGPYLAVAWSGSKDEAVRFCNEVIGSHVHDKPTREKLQEIYNDLDNPRELSLICMFRKASGIETFWLNANQIQTINKDFQNVVVQGTGQKKLSEIINGLHSTANGAPNKLEFGISQAIGITSSLLVDEMMTSGPINELFGTGYEIIHPLKDRFEKFSDLTYIFWKIAIEKNYLVGEITPAFAMKYTYCENSLLIRSVHFTNNKLQNDEVHLVKPIYSRADALDINDLKPSTLNSSYICSIFELVANNDLFCFSQTGRFSQSDRPIYFNENKSTISIDINRSYYEIFLRESMGRINNENSKRSIY